MTDHHDPGDESDHERRQVTPSQRIILTLTLTEFRDQLRRGEAVRTNDGGF